MTQPRKRFGQHFLQDSTVIDRMIDCIQPKPEEYLVEIGPGLGALTLPLLRVHPQLSVIELDRDLIPKLIILANKQPQLRVYQADVLEFDFTTLAEEAKKPLRLVGNLPYNISTPLLFHLLEQKHIIEDMHFMLQQEVVERLAAEVNTGDYGRLTVMIQYDFRVEYLFSVPPEAFKPAPKVSSAVVRLIPCKTNTLKNRKIFANIVREAFQYRRKTLRHALGKYFTAEMLLKCGVSPQQRPAEISISQYVNMANFLESI